MVPFQFKPRSSKSCGRLQPHRRKGKRNRSLFFEQLETRHLLAGDWQNPLFRLDVNDDAFVSPIDALVVINSLNSLGSRELTEPFDNGSPTAAYLDVNGDGSVAPSDALALINYLNQPPQPLAVSLALANDSGASATDRVTNDSRVQGQVALGGAAITAARLRVNREDVIPLTLDAEGRFEIDPRLLSSFTEGSAKIGVFFSAANGAQTFTGLRLMLDATPPLPPTVTGFSADSGVLGDGITTDDTLLVTGVGEPGIRVRVLFNGNSQETVTVSTDGSWSFGADSKDDGYYAISALSEDTAGNTSPTSDALLVHIATGFLRGVADDPANMHIPDVYFPDANVVDLSIDDRPDGTGLETSRTRLLVQFADTATVSQVNTLLESLGASIIGAMSEIDLVLISIPDTGDFSGLDQALAILESHPAIALVVQDVALEPLAVSWSSNVADPNVADHDSNYPANPNGNSWLWNVAPSNGVAADGNWGLEAVRAPQMWNLNDYSNGLNNQPRTGVLDAGFNDTNSDGANDHPDSDLPGLRTWIRNGNVFQLGASVNHHGEHVAGIIGAGFQNGVGVDGINPFAERHAPGDDHFIGVSHSTVVVPAGPLEGRRLAVFSPIVEDLRLMLANWPDLRVVNISLGYNWGPVRAADPNTNAAAQLVAANQGLVVRKIAAIHPNTMIVAAAGNDSWWGYPNEIEARWASPFNWAGLGPNAFLGNTAWLRSPNVLVVESEDAVVANPPGGTVPSYAWQYTKSDFSNVGGNVSAPGGRILSTVGNNVPDPQIAPYHAGHGPFYPNYETESGTSMAAPQVTGLIGYLLTLDPTLSAAEIRTLITDPAYTRTTVLRNNEQPLPAGVASPAPMIDAFASVMAIDLVHGNKAVQKALVDVDDGTRDGNLRVDPLEEEDVFDVFTSDHRRGDGRITMRDFRAWRDAYLQVHAGDFANSLGVLLDGQRDHVKKDLNFDGSVSFTDVDGTVVTAPAFPGHPVDVPVPTDSSNAPSENAYPRYDFNGDGTLDAWFKTAPFKIDPDLVPSSGNLGFELASSPGFLRDIDVLADPAFWEDVERDGYGEGVTLFPSEEGDGPGSLSPWNEWTYLLGNRDADLAGVPELLRITPDYLHSFDLHIEVDWTAVYPEQDVALIRIESEIQGDDYQQVFTREARITREEDGTSTFVVTIPVWTGHVRIRTAGLDDDSGAPEPNLGSRDPIKEWTDVKIGQDLALQLPAWQVVDLGTLGGPSSSAAAINESGVVVGTSSIDDEFDHAFIYRDGEMIDIHPGGEYSSAQDINDRGDPPIISFDSQPGGLGSFIPAALNNSGQMAGTLIVMENGFLKGHAALSSGGGVLDLQVLAGLGNDWTSNAFELNDYGDVVGTLYFHDPNFNRTDIYPFLYSNGVVTQLPGAGSYGAVDINDAGQVIGSILALGGYHAALWDNGVLTDLGTFGTWRTFARAINNNGTAVGYSWSGPGPNSRYAAWIKTPSGPLTKLDNLLNDSLWQFQFATDINDRGEIVGSGVINGKYHAFLRRRSL